MDSKRHGTGAPRQYKQTTLNFGGQQPRKKAKFSRPEDDREVKRPAQENTGGEHDRPSENTRGDAGKEEALQAATSASSPAPTSNPTTANIRIMDKVGDLFDAPANSVLIHACNTIGSWGGGIAAAFRTHYPDAYRIYNAHCKRSLPQHLVGTALLIAPRDGAKKQHYIGCVFTSKRYGRNKDTPEMILEATGPAMRDLLRQIAREKGVSEIRMCRINSGLFSVPWNESKRVIEALELDGEEVPNGRSVEIVAYTPE